MFKEIATNQQSLFVEHALAPRANLRQNATASYGLSVGPSNVPINITATIKQRQFTQSVAKDFKMMTPCTMSKPSFDKTEKYPFKKAGAAVIPQTKTILFKRHSNNIIMKQNTLPFTVSSSMYQPKTNVVIGQPQPSYVGYTITNSENDADVNPLYFDTELAEKPQANTSRK